MTEDPQADAEERTRSAHRAIEIREKRRRVLSSRPVWITLRCSRRGDSGARILGRTAQAAPCSDGVYGGVAGLPHGRAYGVGSNAGQAGDAVVGGGLGYREGDLRRGGAEVIDG